ncbi:PHP domain protein [Streptomyces laurentii]|uniref:PHP domain protein n=1 Tax=Streptomyces laurentii TaxID=39478 RepID=A0A160P4E8_STRLU|nr:PHP domain protein [Streptomyces laurentii]
MGALRRPPLVRPAELAAELAVPRRTGGPAAHERDVRRFDELQKPWPRRPEPRSQEVRGKETSTRRFFRRPSSVELSAIG